jgi:hypothetical protein
MKDRKIILSKDEFDKMEQELKASRELIKSRTLGIIVRKNWFSDLVYDAKSQHSARYDVGEHISFILGCDGNTIARQMSYEINNLQGQIYILQEKLSDTEQELNYAKSKILTWMQLPWYKRLFKKS